MDKQINRNANECPKSARNKDDQERIYLTYLQKHYAKILLSCSPKIQLQNDDLIYFQNINKLNNQP